MRRNFEKRSAAKMIQLMQEVRKNIDRKPDWIGDEVWAELKKHWESPHFIVKSEISNRNRRSMAGASLHTGGSIPHRLHWKRMVLLIIAPLLIINFTEIMFELN